MTDPVIELPAQFEGRTLPKVAAEVAHAQGGFPRSLTFDFGKLDFIRPAGVVFLSNLVHWLNEKGTKVSFVNCDLQKGVIEYLDDSLFFEQHCGARLSAESSPRDTTRPLLRIAQKDSHAWLESEFVPSIVEFDRVGDAIQPRAFPDVGFCPGTTIDIEIRTDAIEELPEEREELQW